MNDAVAQRFRAANIVVLSPNWLGDAVLSLPALADVRRTLPEARIAVAARASVAGLFRLVPNVDGVVRLQSDARWWRRAAFRADAAALAGFDAALLFPNSFQSAWLAHAARIPLRAGYATDIRRRLLTQAVPRARGGHQAEYYQRLTAALAIPSGPSAPVVEVPAEIVEESRALLGGRADAAGDRLIVFAPGAAYGKAKQWIPGHVAALMARLADERLGTSILVGSAADASTARAILGSLTSDARRHTIDLVGRTSLAQLAGVLAAADACVCNDSGAMHLAAAVGTPVVATFGPTDERATAPRPRGDARASVVTHDVFCRPCMLRECPIDHRCMRGISPDAVFESLAQVLA